MSGQKLLLRRVNSFLSRNSLNLLLVKFFPSYKLSNQLDCLSEGLSGSGGRSYCVFL